MNCHIRKDADVHLSTLKSYDAYYNHALKRQEVTVLLKNNQPEQFTHKALAIQN